MAKAIGGKPEVEFKNLPQVHARRDAERREDDVHGIAVFIVWHVFFRQDLGNNAFITMTPGHLIAYRYLLLGRYINLYLLQYAGR